MSEIDQIIGLSMIFLLMAISAIYAIKNEKLDLLAQWFMAVALILGVMLF